MASMNCGRFSILYRKYSTSLHKQIVSQAPQEYDIVISGGGMIGSTLACVLARNPMLRNQKILLIEGAKRKNWSLPPSYSNRVSALNPATRKLLESVGIWKHIEEARFKPVKQMKVWGSGSEAAVEFRKSNNTDGHVAYIVENDVLIAAVNKELEKLEDIVSINYGCKVSNYQLPLSASSSDLATVQLEDGKTYMCSLLLGTDGANSKVRDTMGVEYIKWSYNQSAIVATLRLEKMESNDIAWQRFLSTGPVALLPLSDELSSLVWSTTTENAKELLRMPEIDFVNALNNTLTEPPQSNSLIDFTSKFAAVALKNIHLTVPSSPLLKPPTVKTVEEGSRAAFPLGFGHSSCYVRPGVALLGDAAHRVHPLAGQGVNLGFGDIDSLSKLLAESVMNGNMINSYSTLKRYETERLRHNLPTMLAIDLINKVYSNSNTVLMAVGDIGIQLANSFTPVKDLMMKQASS